jgi:mannose-6-phosphate isomerase
VKTLLRLPPNQPQRFYQGGEAIARFRGLPPTRDHVPEDWVGSTTTVFGDGALGLSRLEDGVTLRDFLSGDGAAFLDPGRTDTRVLVKLLDAGERLPVHCHPDRGFARRHFGLAYGKTEAWLITETEGDGPEVGVGFREETPLERLAELVRRQEVNELLSSLNRIVVSAGDVLFVPAGLPHAIGRGIFMVEVQEPTDLSILLEWRGFADGASGDRSLGLSFDESLAAVDRSAWPPERLAGILGSMSREGERLELLPPEAAPFFRAERLRPDGQLELESSFSILVVIGGAGRIQAADGSLDLRAGETALVGHGTGPTVLSGAVDVIRCRPAAGVGG